MNKKKKIVLGICSSVSIYKSCEIIRLFQKKGFHVQVIMTKNATRFISPLLFGALTRDKVLIELFDQEASEGIAHVGEAKGQSLFLVAPATANILGKFASGLADDFMSTFYLAIKCPVLVAPAMNEAMFLHPQTQQNIMKLKACGVKFVEPEKGYLACKDEGWGRLASPEKIVEESLMLLKMTRSLKGKVILISAGPTQEYLDPVRFITNRSSGKMGYELASEAVRRGAEVVLISGPTDLSPPWGAELRIVRTAQEMGEELLKHFPKADIVFMAAAVSDFKFSKEASEKIKKQKANQKIELIQTQDILKNLGIKKRGQILVGFAAETENLVENAQKKIKEKNLDLIVANNVSEEGVGFGSDFNRVTLIYPDGRKIPTEKKSKHEISGIILNEVKNIIGKRN
ncbi:bifunctional phosphopantothenoylcysteine decarboxylase/phosphopantothenate--cysteine ligase CoaBC [Acidobacteriota bacterium]